MASSAILILFYPEWKTTSHSQEFKQPTLLKSSGEFLKGSRTVESKWAQAASILTTLSIIFWTIHCWITVVDSLRNASKFLTSKRAPNKWYKSLTTKWAWKTLKWVYSLSISTIYWLKQIKSGYSKFSWTFCRIRWNLLLEMVAFWSRWKGCLMTTFKLVWQIRGRASLISKRTAYSSCATPLKKSMSQQFRASALDLSYPNLLSANLMELLTSCQRGKTWVPLFSIPLKPI